MTTRLRHRGSIVLLALIIGEVIMTMTVAFFGYFGSYLNAERLALASAQAEALAEAGIDEAVYQLTPEGIHLITDHQLPPQGQ